MSSNLPLLQLKGVTRRFESAGGRESLEILSNIDLSIEPSESLSIIGPSGSGKSTLLNIIGTLDKPSAGQVLLNGKDLSELDSERLAQVRNQEMGFIFQLHHLLPQLTVLENVLVPTLASERKTTNENEARAHRLLDRVGLGERLDHRPAQLSGGERQRVAVVRALINSPKLLLADEPTGALDQTSAHSLARLLLELNREEDVTLIVVTHALDLAEQMQRVYELKHGSLHAHAASAPSPSKS